MGLETGLQCLSFSLLAYLSSFKYLQAIVMYSFLKQSYYCGNTVVMSTGNTGWVHMLPLRDVGLARKWKSPMCVIRQPPEKWTFLPLLFWKSKSHQTPHLLRKLRHRDSVRDQHFHSFRKLCDTGKMIAVKTKGSHVPWWWEHPRRRKPTISAALLQTLHNST